jgi:hypothetical protein
LITFDASEDALTREFKRIAKQMYGVQALLHWSESALLYVLARDMDANGVTVELGAHLGGSTVALGLGCREHGAGLVSVDMWTTDHAGQVGWGNENLFPTWWRNARDKGVGQVATGLRGKTEDVVKSWGTPIRLLFIDADHTYEGVKADYTAWSPFVWRDGIIAFHDYGVEPGVTRLVDELAADENCPFKTIGVVVSIAMFCRQAGDKGMWPW